MKYLGLVYIDRDKLDDNPPSECMAYAATLKDSGRCLAAEALECCTPTLTSVRTRNGKISVTDGPFTETKELLAGVYVLEVGSPDEAVDLVSRIPCVSAGGRVELRAIMEAE